jgi:hypothetical protein
MLKKCFKIDSEIYDENVISRAIEDFEEVAKIEFSNNLLCIEAESEEETLEIFNEFMNYVV